jgi:predicted transcriptional regulator
VADYINKNILSQAYIHVEPTGIETEEQLEAFKENLRAFALSRTEFFLSDGLDINIEFEEGSIKARVTVIGTLMLLLQGISSYKDFREGLQLLHSDAKWLSDAIISESLYQTKAKHHDVIRVEARTGIIGSVHKILNQLGRIKSGAKGAMLASDIVEKIDDVQDELSKLMENICDLNDRNLVAQECKYLVQELPDIPVPPKDKTNSDHAINEYRRKKSSLSSSVDIHLFIEK